MTDDATKKKQSADEHRTLLQNSYMWPLLTDIAKQIDWPVLMGGQVTVRKLDSESWKNILTAALEKEQLLAQGIDGGWVLMGSRTSKMSIAKMRTLIDLIKHFGDSKQVRWSAPKRYEEYLATLKP